MRYLKISNPGEITQEEIELLGMTDKRDNPDLIGSKGSGVKFSRLQALRQGVEFIITTKDFINRMMEKDGDSRVYFHYVGKGGKVWESASSYTRMAGIADWIDDWFILREVVQNARDAEFLAGERSNPMGTVLNKIKIVSSPAFAPPGQTDVYISLTDRLEQVFQNLGQYLCDENVFLVNKRGEDKTRIYNMGLFVEEMRFCGFASYNLATIDLTESRTIKYSYQVYTGILRGIVNESRENIREFLRYCYRDFENPELSGMRQYSGIYLEGKERDALVSAARDEFGDVIIHNAEGMSEYMQERARTLTAPVIHLGDPLAHYLTNKHTAGRFESLTQALARVHLKGFLRIRETELAEEKRERLKKQADNVRKLLNFSAQIFVFETFQDETRWVKGVCEEGSGEIGINMTVLDSDRETFMTLLEEAIHFVTGAKDMTRGFQEEALGMVWKALQMGDGK